MKNLSVKGAIAPTAGKRSKYLFPVSTQQLCLTDVKRSTSHNLDLAEKLGDSHVFMPPLPSAAATNSKAIDSDVVQYILQEFSLFSGVKHITLEWGRALSRMIESKLKKQKNYPLTPSLPKKSHCDIVENKTLHLVAGPHIKHILRENVTDQEVDEVSNASPRRLSELVDTKPTKKPRSRYLDILLNERAIGLSNWNFQFREIVRRGTVLTDRIIRKKTVDLVRFRAKDTYLAPVLPLQSIPKTSARWLFRMDVEDNTGAASFSWTKWIAQRLQRRQVIAKKIVDSSIRFSIPANLKELEELSVIEYLDKFCEVEKQRVVVYEALFSRIKQLAVDMPALKLSVTQLMQDTLKKDDLDEFTRLLGLTETYSFNLATFCKCVGLCERLFAPVFDEADESENPLDDIDKWSLQAGPLERLDFWLLSRRIAHLNVDPKLRQLLEKLEEKANSQTKEFPFTPTAHHLYSTRMQLFRRKRTSKNQKKVQKQGTTFGFHSQQI
ncbi:unnamed protein product [Mesocestoides corti]|uniref:Mitochondrial transcription termination factor 1 n=1 Tax=Mesocestoides corti TaxID=53468 RepID=A0A0R3UEJ9_MESCO|nr:unnamed protein product [Mesocestoides corti]